MRIISVILGFCVALAVQGCTLTQRVPQNQLHKQALESLRTFQEVVTDKNYKQLGFKSFEEVRLSALGQPIQVFMVRLDHLREFEEGNELDKLLVDTKMYVYPVTVMGKVRSSIELLKQKDKWLAVSFGAPKYTRKITDERARQVKLRTARTEDLIVVKIPSLRLQFLGYRDNKQLMLVPLFDVPQLDFTGGVSISANTVFTKLAPVARKHDGLPR